MANLDLAGPDGPQHTSYVVNLVCKGLWIGIFAVKILATNRHADDPVMPVLLHGG